MPDPKRILIVRPSALGDVCRTVPLLATLRRAYPRATIDWIVQAEYAPAIASHPALDEAVLFPRERFARWWWSPAVAWEMRGWFAALGRRRYDLVFDCQGLGRSGLITWATRAPRRVGLRAARELGWLGYTVRHPRPAASHTVDQMMSLLIAEGLEPVLDMGLHAADEDRRWWRRKREGWGRGTYGVLAPTSRWPAKRWPESSWSSLIRPLFDRGFERLVLVGSPAERRQVEPLLDRGWGEGIVDLAGKTSLGQTMAVIAEAGVVIAHDSAPLHMAVGFARPCVGLYGPTDPAVVGPYGHPEAAIRKYQPRPGETINFKERRLGGALMALIRPDDVLERVDQILVARRRSQGATAAVGGAVGADLAERAAS